MHCRNYIKISEFEKNQNYPFCLTKTTWIVFQNNLKSRKIEAHLRYSNSIFCLEPSAKEDLLRRDVCHKPVMPGLIENNTSVFLPKCFNSSFVIIRGPMVDIFPESTWINCGNSSIDVLLKNFPIFPRILGSSLTLCSLFHICFCSAVKYLSWLSESVTMVLNL